MPLVAAGGSVERTADLSCGGRFPGRSGQVSGRLLLTWLVPGRAKGFDVPGGTMAREAKSRKAPLSEPPSGEVNKTQPPPALMRYSGGAEAVLRLALSHHTF